LPHRSDETQNRSCGKAHPNFQFSKRDFDTLFCVSVSKRFKIHIF
jgi:hypothetical protein